MSKLVIVESPTKVKTISKFLPKDFKVASSVGHIRDLPGSKSEIPAAIKGKPWADLAVDVDGDFTPHYIMIKGKSKVISELKAKLKEATELYVATDEDREGEAIGWHLLQVLKPKVPVKRMVFNEITREAIEHAVAHPRAMDEHLVAAQETRRILDRLYGYTLSPLLWKKIGGNLSAGRVQSVAVRLIVVRERERMRFRSANYWDLKAKLEKERVEFEARLSTIDGKPVATGRDFDETTGDLKSEREVVLLDEAQARALEARLKTVSWTVTNVESQDRESKPPTPFITSTLQQEASNRVNLSARETMRTAQALYEAGLITYMRTDSPFLSDEGLNGARDAVRAMYGAEYVPAKPRTYEHKKGKGAQEAHEGIRPAGRKFIAPADAGLGGRERDLYELIFRRTLASQMPNERYTSTTVTLEADNTTFTATGKQVLFPGWRAAYGVTGEEEPTLPPLAVGDRPKLNDLVAEGHETKPPARYTEPTLVKALEEDGIGRPSTYADIIETILGRKYAVRRGKALVPTLTAFAVVGLLEKHFPTLVDEQFTAKMEESLDEIAAGDAESLPYLKQFYAGPDGIKPLVDARMETIDPGEARIIEIPGVPFTVRIGRFGPYVETEVDGERVSASIPEGTTPDELTPVFLEELLARKAEGPKVLGKDPKSGLPVYILTGRFGPYVQLGEAKGKEKPPRSSLPQNKGPDSVTLDDALFLLSLPRELGAHPAGGRVIAALGRYGPYVAHEKGGDAKPEYRSLASEGELRTVDLAKALQLLSQPKVGRGGGARTVRKVLKELGAHPRDGQPVRVLDGRFGPYVNHGKTNATLPKGSEPTKLTMDEALSLLEAREARGPSRR